MHTDYMGSDFETEIYLIRLLFVHCWSHKTFCSRKDVYVCIRIVAKAEAL